jgi:hypothetical protein
MDRNGEIVSGTISGENQMYCLDGGKREWIAGGHSRDSYFDTTLL